MDTIRESVVEKLSVKLYETKDKMGRGAATEIATCLRETLQAAGKARVVFAAAASQNEMLAALALEPGIDWSRVQAFHMDEYVGLADDAPQRFGTYLREHIFDLVSPGRIEYVDGSADNPQSECARYARLLAEEPIDIVCAGIGENGHMAFNDPHVALFDDPLTVKPVKLDQVCRLQQVHDGAFKSLAQVPETAITLTMSALMSAKHIFCVVPGPTKARAVQQTLESPIRTNCPATVMRRHADATLYIDLEAAQLLS